MKKIILTLLVIILTAVFAMGDIYIKRVKETAPYQMMGQKKPGETEIEHVWMTRDKYVSDGKILKAIIDYKKGNIVFLVKPKKFMFEIPLNFTPESLPKYFPPKVAEILKSIKLRDVWTQVDKKKVKIGNWDCFKTVMSMEIVIPALNLSPRMKIVTWMTKEAPFNYTEYKKGMNDFFEDFFSNFIKPDEKTLAEFRKIDGIEGFEVGADVEFSVFGSTMKSNMRVIEVKEMKAPPGMYSVPGDYKKMDIFTALGMARQNS